MSNDLDLRQFYDTFFDEAEELLADMERLLLETDADAPQIETLNAIFRAAHSIKGGAATFGFTALTETTHLLENVLDSLRRNELTLRVEMIDVFLRAKDVLQSQVESYRSESEPDKAAAQQVCEALREFMQGERPTETPGVPAAAAVPVLEQPASKQEQDGGQDARLLKIELTNVTGKDRSLVLEEIGNLGDVCDQKEEGATLCLWLKTTCTPDDLIAVCCFVIDEDQIAIEPQEGSPPSQTVDVLEAVATPSRIGPSAPPSKVAAAPSAIPASPRAADRQADSIRVGVEKVDQIINLVGELVITQAMLAQSASTLDPTQHDRLLNGLEHLERNARDLQEAVMSVRMMPMDYVFSRFPRVVRDFCAKSNKQIELVTEGKATELDKSLIERIIDPLTHLVRNSLDHGIEAAAERVAKGKPEQGTLKLSAQHSGGNIVIEVTDDGAGLNREKILAKAASQGIPVSENAPDEEVWQLIFAPGFSTAAQVTDISGRGVGMDVVKRNIQSMGGHVQVLSKAGEGTRTRIILPLTLAILDGMSVRVGEEIYILPLGNVAESLQPVLEQIHTVSGSERVLHVRGEYLPLVELARVFNVAGAQSDPTQAIAVILQAEDRRFALLVDHLIAQQQVVVKNLESNYRKVPGISAATILGDGEVALIVDVFALAHSSKSGEALAARAT